MMTLLRIAVAAPLEAVIAETMLIEAQSGGPTKMPVKRENATLSCGNFRGRRSKNRRGKISFLGRGAVEAMVGMDGVVVP